MEIPTLFAPGARAADLGFAAADARDVDGSLGGTRTAPAQAARSLAHLRNTLRGLGQDLDQVVSLWVLLTDYGDREAVSRVVDEHFPDASRYPATCYLGVSGLEGECVVRLDAVAYSGGTRSPIAAPGVPLARGARTHGVRVGDLYFLSGVDASGVTGDGPAETLGRQTTAVLDRISTVLEGQGLWLGDVGRTFMFMSDLSVRSAYGAARQERYRDVFALDQFPANSGIGVPDLGPGIMLRSVAIAGRDKQYVVSDLVRVTAGSFSQSVRFGDWLFVAGQDAIDLNFQTEAVGDLAGQTVRTLRYLKYIVEAAGATMDDVVKTTVYLIAGQDRALFAEPYRRFFETETRGGWLPSGLTLEVRELATDVLVEIDAVVYLGQR
jgi:2-iminobutanoate/2-iminopropanoate deaminase